MTKLFNLGKSRVAKTLEAMVLGASLILPSSAYSMGNSKNFPKDAVVEEVPVTEEVIVEVGTVPPGANYTEQSSNYQEQPKIVVVEVENKEEKPAKTVETKEGEAKKEDSKPSEDKKEDKTTQAPQKAPSLLYKGDIGLYLINSKNASKGDTAIIGKGWEANVNLFLAYTLFKKGKIFVDAEGNTNSIGAQMKYKNSNLAKIDLFNSEVDAIGGVGIADIYIGAGGMGESRNALISLDDGSTPSLPDVNHTEHYSGKTFGAIYNHKSLTAKAKYSVFDGDIEDKIESDSINILETTKAKGGKKIATSLKYDGSKFYIELEDVIRTINTNGPTKEHSYGAKIGFGNNLGIGLEAMKTDVNNKGYRNSQLKFGAGVRYKIK